LCRSYLEISVIENEFEVFIGEESGATWTRLLSRKHSAGLEIKDANLTSKLDVADIFNSLNVISPNSSPKNETTMSSTG
jgi:hypothetical protein